MKTILLTGASGFIGSYFRNKYKDKYNIKTFSFRNDDFDSLDLSDIDTIIHLSALVHQMKGAKKNLYYLINVDNTIKLAKKAKRFNVKHFIFMSTVKVYGEESNIIYDEFTPCNPQDDYGKSKLEAENKLLKLEDKNFIVSIIRTPMVYGYGVKGNMRSLIRLVSKAKILPLKGINNKRSIVYVGNLCHLINQIVVKRKKGVFLAADDELLSTTELVELIARKLKKRIILVKIPFFEKMLKKYKPEIYKRLYGNLMVDNSNTKKILDLINPYSVEEGIRLMIEGEY